MYATALVRASTGPHTDRAIPPTRSSTAPLSNTLPVARDNERKVYTYCLH